MKTLILPKVNFFSLFFIDFKLGKRLTKKSTFSKQQPRQDKPKDDSIYQEPIPFYDSDTSLSSALFEDEETIQNTDTKYSFRSRLDNRNSSQPSPYYFGDNLNRSTRLSALKERRIKDH